MKNISLFRAIFVLFFLLTTRDAVLATDASRIFSDPRMVALATATASGNIAGVRQSLDAGADPRSVGRLGFTVTHFALESKTPDTLKIVLDAGADPISQRSDGHTAPHDAASRDGNDGTFLKTLLDHGVDPNLVGGEARESLLMSAVMASNRSAVEILAKAGANMNVTEELVGSTLHVALTLPDFKLAKMLVDFGADPKLTVPSVGLATEEYCKHVRRQHLRDSADLDSQFAELEKSLEKHAMKFPCTRTGQPR